jgi:hypothetical protein
MLLLNGGSGDVTANKVQFYAPIPTSHTYQGPFGVSVGQNGAAEGALNILTVDDTEVGLIYAAASNKLKSNDGENTAEVSCTWAANDELIIAVEMLASTFRIGFAKTADSAITFGDPATYDGSHNSGAKLRLAMLNAIPMWAEGVYVSSATGLTAADIRRYI